MPMPPYTIACCQRECPRVAIYKIAARWSDGVTHELKTYALTCVGCLPVALRRAGAQRAACRLAPGETLEPPAVYELQRGQRDYQLKRRQDLESVVAAS